MEHKEAELASRGGRAEVVATGPGMGTFAATNSDNCNDDFPLESPGTQVGTNHLIVSNILRYCDSTTIRASTRVNHLWRNLAIPSASACLHIRLKEKYLRKLLRRVGNLAPFTNLYFNHKKMMLNTCIDYSPNLVSLHLQNTHFVGSTDIYDIVCESFPCLKTLILEDFKVFNQQPLLDFQIPTPKLETLHIFKFESPYRNRSSFMNTNFCFNVISKLRNLKELRIGYVVSRERIPIFEALTRGNIHLEVLQYDENVTTSESSEVINNYLRGFGESLRVLELTSPGSKRTEIFKGYAGKHLQKLTLKENNFHLTLSKHCDGTFGMSVSIPHVHNIPNISDVSLRGTYDDFSQPFPSIQSPVSGSLSVKCVTVQLDMSDNLMDEESRQARNVLFELFPNVSGLTLLLSINSSCEAAKDFITKAERNWPYLRSLSIEAPWLTNWNCDKWRNLITHVVLHLTDLEDVEFLDGNTWFDTPTTLPILLLANLTRLHVEKIKISSTLHDMLTNHVVDLQYTALTVQD